jgi:serine/threonine protein kinase
MLERLEYIHSKDYIHRDIKPHNFLMGLKDPNMLYIIDFGLAKKYRSKKGKHIKFSITNNIIGTPRYCSYNALRGAEQSRRDDLESLFYVLLYFFRGSVPWQNLKIKSRNERFKRINEIKKKINYKILCKDLPEEFLDFANYIKNLNFEEEPNYKYMQKLFYLILLKIKEENDDKFSWIKSNLVINNNFHSHKNIFRKKPSIHKRLFEKISNSLEKKLSKRENKNYLTIKNNNSIKDNITLISLNIENLDFDKIKKSNSYACVTVKNGEEGIIQQSMSNLNIKNDILKKNYNNLSNKGMDSNNKNLNKNNLIIKRNPTTIKLKNISNLLSEEGLKNKNYLESNNFSNNNESIKNLFLRKNQILYTSPSLILEEKPIVNTSRTNINNNFDWKKKKIFKTENNKNVIRNYKNMNLDNNKKNIYKSVISENSYSRNNYKKGFIYSYEDRNNKNKQNNYRNIQNSYNNNMNDIKYHHLYNNSTSNIIIKTKNSNCNNRNNNSLNNIKIYTYNGHNINLEKNRKIDMINKGNLLPFFNIYQKEKNFNKDLLIERKNDIKFNSLKNRNINLNIKLINNNNYNNVPLMIYKKQTNKINNNNISSYAKQKKINKRNIINMINNQMVDINSNINSNLKLI